METDVDTGEDLEKGCLEGSGGSEIGSVISESCSTMGIGNIRNVRPL